jgi:nucleoside-diphosphate-sugar epimerase
MAAFARRRQHVPFSALRLHALREDITAALTAADDDDQRERLHLWGWTSFDSAAAACLLALHRPAPGHGVYNIVGTRTASSTTSEELARRWYPKVPLRAPLPGDAGFYSTVKALAELGWDAHDEHPTVSAGERPPPSA